MVFGDITNLEINKDALGMAYDFMVNFLINMLKIGAIPFWVLLKPAGYTVYGPSRKGILKSDMGQD